MHQHPFPRGPIQHQKRQQGNRKVRDSVCDGFQRPFEPLQKELEEQANKNRWHYSQHRNEQGSADGIFGTDQQDNGYVSAKLVGTKRRNDRTAVGSRKRFAVFPIEQGSHRYVIVEKNEIEEADEETACNEAESG